MVTFPRKKMASIDIPYGSIEELSARISELADNVLGTDPYSREGQDARRLYRIGFKQLTVKAKVTEDPLLSALLFDVASKLED